MQNPSLRWKSGGNTTTYIVYISKTPNPSDAPNSYLGETSGTSAFLYSLQYHTKYYWRVDSKNARGITKGDVWSFTTGPREELPFANYVWDVKYHQDGTHGPGYNYWSDSKENVWLDSQGHLHLKIVQDENGRWNCAEVSTQLYAAHGIQRFFINGRFDTMPSNVVFSVFIYKDPAHEIDIEFSKWRNPSSSFNTQYVVNDSVNDDFNKTYVQNVNRYRFYATLNGAATTHVINWQPTYVEYKSIHGHYVTPPSESYIYKNITLTGYNKYIPKESSKMQVHMNLYLDHAAPLNNGESYEIEITDVDLTLKPYWY